MKKCSKCENYKSLNEFNKHSGNKDNLQNLCRDCNNTLRRKWYKNNSEKVYNYSLKRRFRNKDFVSDFKKDKCCSKCGESHPACLNFHHIDESLKRYNISEMKRTTYSIKTIKIEIEKCIILCANCHRKLHWEQQNN